MGKDAFVIGVCAGLLVGVCCVLLGTSIQRRGDERLCRHTIQKNFGVERAEAERLIRRQREEE